MFDVTSPNGVLLLREASKAIVTYGERILTITDIPQDKVYALKYPHLLCHMTLNECHVTSLCLWYWLCSHTSLTSSQIEGRGRVF